MNKKELKERLLKAGLDEALVDQRLEDISDAEMKEMDGVPFATVLKEFQGIDGDQVFTLDPEVLQDFTSIVRKEVASALSELTIEIPDSDISLKEVPGLVELKEQVEELAAKIDLLLRKDEVKMKELLDETPRASKLRIRRAVYKAMPMDDEDMEDDAGDEEDGEEEEMPKGKKKSPYHAKKESERQPSEAFMGADGEAVTSMTEFILGGKR